MLKYKKSGRGQTLFHTTNMAWLGHSYNDVRTTKKRGRGDIPERMCVCFLRINLA